MTQNIFPKTRKEVDDIPTEEYAPHEKSKEIKADLSLNINPFGVSNKVMNKLKNIKNTQISRYYLENKTLQEEIARYIDVTSENILIGDGCDGCLDMIAKTYIQLDTGVIIPTPTFHRYEFHTKLMGGKTNFIQMENFVFNADSTLREAKKNNAKIIFLCNPNNPTGMEIDKREKLKLIENFSGLVVIDEALADTTAVNGSHLIKKYNNLIIVRSFSKTFGLASLRIGYIVSNATNIKAIKKVSSPFRVNGVAQELAIEALKDKDHIENSKLFLEKERNYLTKELALLGLKPTKSITTNFLLDIDKLGSVQQVISILKDKGVLVTDAHTFRVLDNKYIRIAIASETENRYFIDALKKIVKDSNIKK
jgi:histidinol-phosphate aminotransferase